MDDETEKLINLVHNFPYLYDTRHCEYKTNIKKAESEIQFPEYSICRVSKNNYQLVLESRENNLQNGPRKKSVLYRNSPNSSLFFL